MKHLAIVIFTILLGQTQGVAQDLSGAEIIKKVSDQLNQQTSMATMNLTIVTTSGKERQFTYTSYSADRGEKSAMVYTAPVRVKGQATLMLDNADNIWSYFPRTDRIRKLATHAKKQKMQGSDFTYEDMGSGNTFVTDFDVEKLADEPIEDHDCYRIRLAPNEEASSAYARIDMWVIKENMIPVVIDYYDEDEPDICKKRMTQSDFRLIDGIPTAMKAGMHNNLDDSDTRLELTECRYNLEIDESRFTRGGFYK